MQAKLLKRDAWIDKQADILGQIVEGMRVLSGDVMGPSDATWQDVAENLACTLEVLALHVRKIQRGKHSSADASHLTMLIDQLTESVEE